MTIPLQSLPYSNITATSFSPEPFLRSIQRSSIPQSMHAMMLFMEQNNERTNERNDLWVSGSQPRAGSFLATAALGGDRSQSSKQIQ